MITIEDGNSLATRNSGVLNKPSAPLTVGALELALLRRYPREDAEQWDRTGLLAGDPATLVTGVAIALDPTCDAIEAAERDGANVLLTHHPAFIDAPVAFSPSYEVADASGVNVFAAISKGVALMNFHTALDASREATRMFPRIMSLDFERLLVPLRAGEDKGYGILCSVKPDDKPFKLAHLAARATSVFARPPRVWGDFDERIETVVIANGSANSVASACADAHADCLVCGEIGYHNALSLLQAGVAIVEVGHDVSEFPLCALLAQAAVEAGVSQDAITMVDQASKWSYPEATRV